MARSNQNTLALTADRSVQVQKQERLLTDLELQFQEAKSKCTELKAAIAGANAELRRLISGNEPPLPFERPRGEEDGG